MQWFETVFGKWVVTKRWWIIILTILVVVTASSGVRFLTINNDNRIFFSEQNPQLKALEALENTYNRVDNVFFVIAPKDGDVFTQRTLTAIEELTEASWKIPYSSRVDSIANFQHAWAKEDELIVEDLVQNSERFSDKDLKRVKQIALSEPQIVNNIVSSSGHVTAVDVNILLPGKSIKEVPEVTAFSRKVANDFRQKYPDIDLYLTGGVVIDNAFGEASQDDMATLTPLMLFVLVILVGLALRSFTGTFSTSVIILISMFTGMGLAGWLGITINAASVNATTIILTLAVADSVHILTTIFHHMRLGKSKHDAISESMRINLQPVFLTSITTAVGFLSMNLSDAPPFRDLGNIVAMGVMAAFLYSVLFLPALIAILPVRIKPRADEAEKPCCNKLANFIINRRNVVFLTMVGLIAIFAAGLFQIELNENFYEYFGKRYEIRKANDFVEANLTGLDRIEYSLESGETGGINKPEYLATVENFVNWYREQPNVIHVFTITDTMKRLNKNMHADDENYYRIPDERNLAAQYLLLYEMSLPFGLDLNNQINVDKSATRMIVTVRGVTSNELREMDTRAREWLKANAPKEMFTYGSGLSVIWAHIAERNIKSMLGASFWALLLISGILIFALRSFKLGVLSLIPNLAPAFMAFGIWGLTVGRVGIGLSVLASMTLGIVVDDTVHFLSKFLRARRESNMDAIGAVRYAFNTVGTAMWVTTVALVAGFSVLTLSGYKMNSDLGLMAAITITLALVMDFFLLPTLLIKVEG